MNLRNKQFILLFYIFVAIVVLVITMVFYNIFLQEELSEISSQNLNQQMSNNVETYQLKFESNINLLESTASLLPVWDYLRYIDYESDQYDYISSAFDYIMVINPNGYAVGSDGNVGDAYEEDYFKDAMDGKTVISDLIVTESNGIKTIVISTPMIANGETRGVLAGLIYLETLNDMFNNPIREIKANILVDSDGYIISNGVDNTKFIPTNNVFEIIQQSNLSDEKEFDLFKNDVLTGTSGERKINFDGEVNRVIYTPVGIKDWSIISIVPEAVIQSTTNIIFAVTAFISVFAIALVCAFAYIINFSQRKHLKNIEEIAYVSPLTKINTVVKFKLDADDFFAKHKGDEFIIIKFDIENFRLLNESLGVSQGDEILKNMADAFKIIPKGKGLCAHIHNDEFLVLLAVKEKSLSNWHSEYTNQIYMLLGENFNYNLRIVSGYYCIDEKDKADISSCIEKVNIAHKTAKEEKVLISEYSKEYLAHAIEVKEIENNMEAALQNGEFRMFLQPELGLAEGKMVAAEALVRWFDSDEMKTPNTFIPIFEQNGFILKLDMYIFEQACKYLKTWTSQGREPFNISVNFSRKHFYTANFAAKLSDICNKYGVSAKYLGVEITETSMLSNEADLIAFIKDLKNKGFRVFMDDFGTGYSSLGMLKNTPVDVLKIDKSFFSESQSRERSVAVVSSVIRLSKDLNISTVAEGVETKEDLNMLKNMGCDIIQGYYYAKPMSGEELYSFYDNTAGYN